MYEFMDMVTLKSGEKVEMGVVKGPDAEWADRVEGLLGHKGEVWRWGNHQVLTEDLELDAYFYILHREGTPFSNMMNIEMEGVGIFGHVFTRPEDRRQGAASELMRRLMDHFTGRGGQALFLGTGFDSPPYHIYRTQGFEGVEDKSGNMAFYAHSQEAFEATYFAEGRTEVETLDWVHWPASPALFLADFPGVVRGAGMGIFGRGSTEGKLLPLLRDAMERKEQGKPARVVALRQVETTAVVGLGMWSPDPMWPHSCLVDVYCHPAFWDRAEDLLSALELPSFDRYIAYSDVGLTPKAAVLSGLGFKRVATHEGRVAVDRARTGFVGVEVWERG